VSLLPQNCEAYCPSVHLRFTKGSRNVGRVGGRRVLRAVDSANWRERKDPSEWMHTLFDACVEKNSKPFCKRFTRCKRECPKKGSADQHEIPRPRSNQWNFSFYPDVVSGYLFRLSLRVVSSSTGPVHRMRVCKCCAERGNRCVSVHKKYHLLRARVTRRLTERATK